MVAAVDDRRQAVRLVEVRAEPAAPRPGVDLGDPPSLIGAEPIAPARVRAAAGPSARTRATLSARRSARRPSHERVEADLAAVPPRQIASTSRGRPRRRALPPKFESTKTLGRAAAGDDQELGAEAVQGRPAPPIVDG